MLCVIISALEVCPFRLSSAIRTSQLLSCVVYTVSLLATLNAREGLRLHAEQLGQGSLRGLTRTSNIGSRRSIRGVVDAMVYTSLSLSCVFSPQLFTKISRRPLQRRSSSRSSATPPLPSTTAPSLTTSMTLDGGRTATTLSPQHPRKVNSPGY